MSTEYTFEFSDGERDNVPVRERSSKQILVLRVQQWRPVAVIFGLDPLCDFGVSGAMPIAIPQNACHVEGAAIGALHQHCVDERCNGLPQAQRTPLFDSKSHL
jgi:hypothetical protein